VWKAVWVGYLLLEVLLRVVFPIELDEAYYWTWSKAPSWWYVDHPPGVAWILWVFRSLFGDGRVGLRVASMLGAMGLALCVIRSSARLSPPGQALEAQVWAGILLMGSPMFSLGFIPATPDVFQGLSVALLGYATLRGIGIGIGDGGRSDRKGTGGTGDGGRWCWPPFVAGALASLSIVAKHSSALVVLGWLLGLLQTSSGRRFLSDVRLQLGLVLGGVVSLLWFWSDLRHGSGSLAFQWSRVADRGGSIPRIWVISVVLGSLLVGAGPAGFMAMVLSFGWVVRGRGSPGSRVEPTVAALLGGSGVLLVGCLIAAWQGLQEVNWSMPAFLFALPVAAVYLSQSKGVVRRTAKVFGGLGVMAMVLCSVHLIAPSGLAAGKNDRLSRAYGYESLAKQAERRFVQDHAKTLITQRYQPASLLRFYLDDRIPVVELGTRRKSQFDVWPRPVLCSGDRALVMVRSPGVPEELPAHELPGTQRQEIVRKRGRYTLDSFHLLTVEMDASMFDPDGVCSTPDRAAKVDAQ
jgi:hypothetical protein